MFVILLRYGGVRSTSSARTRCARNDRIGLVFQLHYMIMGHGPWAMGVPYLESGNSAKKPAGMDWLALLLPLDAFCK